MAKITINNTKAQILEAYEKLLKEVKKRSEDNLKEKQQRKENQRKVEEVAKATELDIVQQIDKTKGLFVEALDELATSLAEERGKLSKIQEAIKIEEKYLEDLYGIKSGADSLATILLVQKEKEEHFNKEMAKVRLAWEEEKVTYREEQKDIKEQVEKRRKREEEEYQYTTSQKRQQEKDAYLQQKTKQETELKEKRIAFEKEFSEREQLIKESEKELLSLREENEGFAERLKLAVAQAEKEAEERLQVVFKYEKELKEKEVQGQLLLKDQQIKSLESKIKEMEIQLKNADTKVDNSEKTVKDIALKAIENSVKTQFVEREKIKE
ncbi:MAG: hypothetical protein CSA44_00570 [Gammaproteobacteria bacterium]|nr:MAG: hypothetical protein CSA44_00570 [Gammaproteobacteria bacterium]